MYGNDDDGWHERNDRRNERQNIQGLVGLFFSWFQINGLGLQHLFSLPCNFWQYILVNEKELFNLFPANP